MKEVYYQIKKVRDKKIFLKISDGIDKINKAEDYTNQTAKRMETAAHV